MTTKSIEYLPLPIPQQLRAKHERMGGTMLRRWVASVPGGFLRVMLGREPIGKDGALLWHMSVSVANSPDCDQSPIRRATDEQVKAVVRGVRPRSIEWIEQESAGLFRHLYESERTEPQ